MTQPCANRTGQQDGTLRPRLPVVGWNFSALRRSRHRTRRGKKGPKTQWESQQGP